MNSNCFSRLSVFVNDLEEGINSTLINSRNSQLGCFMNTTIHRPLMQLGLEDLETDRKTTWENQLKILGLLHLVGMEYFESEVLGQGKNPREQAHWRNLRVSTDGILDLNL